MENKRNKLYQLEANMNTEDGNILYVAYLRYKKNELSHSCINKLRLLGLDVNPNNYSTIQFTYTNDIISVSLQEPNKMIYSDFNDELFARYCDKFSDKDLVLMQKILNAKINARTYDAAHHIIELAVATNKELRNAVLDSKYNKITEQA